jgi:hypothetical protein
MENVMKAHAAVAAAEMAKTLRAEHAADIHRMVDKVAATNKELADTQNKEDTQSPNAPYARLVLSHSAHHCRARGSLNWSVMDPPAGPGPPDSLTCGVSSSYQSSGRGRAVP